MIFTLQCGSSCMPVGSEDSVIIRTNDILKSSVFLLAIGYIVFFACLILFITFIEIEMTINQEIAICLGFIFFVVSIWLAFIGGILRSV